MLPIPTAFAQTMANQHPGRVRELFAPPAAGGQKLHLLAPMRLGTCEEFGCSWFLHGKEGEDAGAPFKHPAGVQCGDFARCPDPNCPCPGRLAREVGPNGTFTGRRGHLVHDERPALRMVARGGEWRSVVPDEWQTRLHEGVDALQFIATRGL